MVKILSCPNCSNNKNLHTNERITTCSKCGYSWVSVSNANIKSTEIKVVMDSINHYKYTLNNYNNNDNTFPFYAINNKFIENKSSNKNHLLKIHHVDDDFVKQGYVGINKFKINSKHPKIYYDDNVDLSIYKNHNEKVVSDRSNQEYEISKTFPKIKNHIRDHQATSRGTVSKEREEYLNKYAERDPDAFFREYEIVKINDDDSVDIRQRENRTRDYSQNFSSNRDSNIERRSYPEKISSGLSIKTQLKNIIPYDERSSVENQSYLSTLNNERGTSPEVSKSFTNENTKMIEREISNSFANNPSFANEATQNRGAFENNNWKEKKNLSKENYYVDNENSTILKKPFLGINFNNTSTISEYNDNNLQKIPNSPKQKRNPSEEYHTKNPQEILETTLKELPEKEVLKKENEGAYLTYQKYQEKRVKNLNAVKEQQKIRRERWKTKNYTPKKLFNKYQKSEIKKYSLSTNTPSSDFENIKDKTLPEKYLHKETFNSERFNRESLENNTFSKKLREEIINRKEKPSIEEYVYSKKPKTQNLNQKTDAYPSQGYIFSNIDDVINNSQNLDNQLIENNQRVGSILGKNPRLSFFENLKINSDGTIKEDPLGLNQDYNEFFNKAEVILDKKKYTLVQIINELKKRINKDKMSFNLVVIIIIFGFFGMLSQMFTKSNVEKKDEKEINIGQNIVNQIPTIDDTPKFKAAQGKSDTLVVSQGIDGAVKSGESVKTTEQKDSKEILSENKKNIASDLSLEELKQDKLINNENKINSTAPTISSFDKTMMYMEQKLEQLFSNISSNVISNKWVTENNNKYFEINIDISNKVANKSYNIRTIEITLLDISGNVIGTREIHPDLIVRVKETINSTIRIPAAPSLAAKSYVKIKEVTVL